MSSKSPSTPPPAAVSALRSKFEQLAQQQHGLSAANRHNAPPMSAKLEPSPFLNTPELEGKRQRALSSGHQDKLPVPPIRPSTSSSDLKTNMKRPPPPPPSPSHTNKPSTNDTLHDPVPLFRPASIPPSPSAIPVSPPEKQTLVARKPPPPPPPHNTNGRRSDEEEMSVELKSSEGVTSLRSKFAPLSGPMLPSQMSRARSPGIRIVSQPVLSSHFTSEQTIVSDPSRSRSPNNHRHSLSAANPITESPAPIHPERSPLLMPRDYRHDHPPPPPPPLPARSKPKASHSRDTSSEISELDGQTRESYASPLRNEDGGSTTPLPLPNRPTIQPPPSRPPPKLSSSVTSSSSGQSTGTSPISEMSSPNSSTPTLNIPPPLPFRRSPPISSEVFHQATSSSPNLGNFPPPLPNRRPTLLDSDPYSGPASAPPITERKTLGVRNLPPPPTRTIALGDKLPQLRRPANAGSSDESGSEDDILTRGRTVELLPDSSNSSRRPPIIPDSPFTDFRATVPAHTGVVAVSGYHVVVAHSQIRLYDLSYSHSPTHYIELKDLDIDWRVKDPRITSMEFRSVSNLDDRGSLLWLGTKDGHLWELDVRSTKLVSVRHAAHGHAVIHIFRHGGSMITVDENGKTLVFTPDQHLVNIDLALSQPRTLRISDKQGFVKMLGGFLWTSTGSGSGSSANGTLNGPPGITRGTNIRVYDIMSPSGAGKSLVPLEYVGAVTCGTVLSTHPRTVYLGHEGGCITVWSLNTEDGLPVCQEVVKISASDVLSLEGVNDRLWAGDRKGTIKAYAVEHKPWLVTNSWKAHDDLPVQKLIVDPWSIEKCGHLCVVSVGRDETLKYWDGFLGLDWIESQLRKQEDKFSTFRELKVLIVSWNIDAAKPDALVGGPDNVNFLDNVLKSVDSPDIIVFGFQEVIDLENRKMAAKTVLLGGKKKTADVAAGISDKVSRSYKMWHDKLTLAVRLAMPAECPYTVVHAENLVGLFSCIFVKNSERGLLKDADIKTIKRGMGGIYGNKGCIVARFSMDDSSLCFVNCHLAAGQSKTSTRNGDIAAILEEKSVFDQSVVHPEHLAFVGGGDGSMLLDHEVVFLNGDLNYRIDQRRDIVIGAVQANEFVNLLAHDQLLKEIKFNRAFRLRSFVEAPITFAPTYKYDRRSSDYDSSEKNRIPAWCDRILYHTRHPSRVHQLHYRRYEANVSDHRPISAAYSVTIKSVHHDTRNNTKAGVEGEWMQKQYSLLIVARDFYISQGLL